MVTKKEVLDAVDNALDLARKCGEQTVHVRGAINKLVNARNNLDAAIPYVDLDEDLVPLGSTIPFSEEDIDRIHEGKEPLGNAPEMETPDKQS